MQETKETGVPSLSQEDLEEGTATHSSLLAWRIPWTEEPGGLQSMGKLFHLKGNFLNTLYSQAGELGQDKTQEDWGHRSIEG